MRNRYQHCAIEFVLSWRKRLGVPLLFAAFAGLLSACGPPEAATDDDVLAVVERREIRVADFERELARRTGGNPHAIDLRALLDEMVEREALLALARRLDIDADPEVRRAMENVLLGALRQRELEPRLNDIVVEDEEIEALYQAEAENNRRPARVRLALLQLPKGEGILERLNQAREDARDIPAEDGFGALAIRYSEDQAGRYRGGDIGWLELNDRSTRWPPEILEEASRLTDPGALSPLIQAGDTVYLIRLMERVEPALPSLDDAAPAVRRRILMRKRQSAEQEFREEVHASIPIQIFPETLSTRFLDRDDSAFPSRSLPPELSD